MVGIIFFTKLCLIALLSTTIMVPSQQGLSESPSPRTGSQLVYDPMNKRLMLFGGMYEGTSSQVYDDTWVFDWETESWVTLNVEPHPPPRMDYGIVYVSDLEGFLLYGGWNKDGWLGDTWLYDCTSQKWKELHPSITPWTRDSFGICYDEENRVVVLYGGYSGEITQMDDTWLYDLSTSNWREAKPVISPPELYGGKMVFDPSTSAVLLFGGHYYVNGRDVFLRNVWEYDSKGNTWSERQTQNGPSERYWQNVAYEDLKDSVVFFGGRRLGSQYDDTWLYDTSANSWTKLITVNHPQARFQSALAYDPTHKSIVLFGGFTFENRKNFGDTWILDLSNSSPDWRQAIFKPQEGSTPSGIDGFPSESIILGVFIVILLNAQFMKTRQFKKDSSFEGLTCLNHHKHHLESRQSS